MYTITIRQVNGLDLGEGIGHLKKGSHKMDITADHIADLKLAGVQVEVVKAANTQQSMAAQKPTDTAELIAAIRAAVDGLDKANAELWTQTDGVPKTSSVEKALGYNISAAERDEALKA